MEELVFSPESLGGMIKRQRKLKGLTQQEAGQAFRIEQSTFSGIENGIPGTRLETIFRILAALDLEMVIRSKERPKEPAENW